MLRFRSVLWVILLAVGALLACGPAGSATKALARTEAAPITVETREIPKEAYATLAYIQAHDSAPQGYVGGRRFGNYGRGGEQKLPPQDALGRPITYREWDIHPKVPGRNRGPQRLVTGSDGRAWYTADHYATYTEIR